MPLITVQYSSTKDVPPSKAEIAAAVSELSFNILHKDPKVTAIIVQAVEASDWFAGGRSLAEQKLSSVWLDIHITDGTNSKDEKAELFPRSSSGSANCWARCTPRAMSTSMKCARTPTATAG